MDLHAEEKTLKEFGIFLFQEDIANLLI